jgi:hypothetical protein
MLSNPQPKGWSVTAGCNLSNCTNLGEILEAMTVMDEGDAQSWYAAWKATADLAQALARRTQDSLSRDEA